MLIKVCGLREPENIREVVALQPDMIGFIFFHDSLRYVKHLDINLLAEIPKTTKKIGVFVNEELETILTYIKKYDLDGVQLHGFENQELCRTIREEAKVLVIKAFPILTADNFKVTKDYEDVCDYFLFDTKTDVFGGSGEKFDWRILASYQGEKEFILSGGISLEDVKPILKINLHHQKMVGIDLNSKFEIKPGLKDVHKLRAFIHEVRENKDEQDK